MPIYQLDKDLWFPPPSEYEEHGIAAIGGDLSVSRLLLAYQNGLFPWYNEGDPITWWCPFKRMVLKPSEVRVSKSSRNLINRGIF
jgi:leucyl/phenylalanyl-tRNA--protein transferase